MNSELSTAFLWSECRELIKIVNSASRMEDTEYFKKMGFNENNTPTESDTQQMILEVDNKLAELKPTMNRIEELFDEILTRIRTHIVIGRDQFFGAELLEVELKTDLTLSPRYNEEPITTIITKDPMEIHVNPLFLETYKVSHIESMLISEIVALALGYPTDFNRLNSEADEEKHKALLRSMSVATTEIVKKYVRLDRMSNKKGLQLAENPYIIEDLRIDSNRNANKDESMRYYYEIYKDIKNDVDAADLRAQEAYQSFSHEYTNDGVSTPYRTNVRNQTHAWEKQFDPKNIENKLKEMLKKAYESTSKTNSSNRDRGDIPAAIQDRIDMIYTETKINWTRALANLIGIIPVPYRKSPARLNKKYPERRDLFGRLPKRKVQIVCIMDVSGSMSDSDFVYCLNEVFGVSKANETEVTVIECDATVQKVYTLDGAKKIEKVQRSACGGTLFTPAIEYVNDHNFRDAICIYFTDGYGEEQIPKPRVQKMMWVVLEDESNLSVDPPYGRVYSLKYDEKYQNQKGK